MKALWHIGWGLFFFSLPVFSAESEKSPGPVLLDKLGDCNWQVTYRGRIYDLGPLTRESLSRPVENDIRYALQRVPEAAESLREIDRCVVRESGVPAANQPQCQQAEDQSRQGRTWKGPIERARRKMRGPAHP